MRFPNFFRHTDRKVNHPPPADDEVLIRCHDVGKRFCRDLKRSLWYGVQDMTRDFLGLEAPADAARPERPSLRPQEFWAVEGISFELRRGQCLGLIGRNGAGKTTILKMLGGLIKPDSGSIKLRGVVGGLIALGAGFNPLLTGRENTFVNGAILGLSRRQISSKMDEIEAFADIGEFMDAPVQGYSSGMSVRLGFAIAAILTKPDVLLLDEVLAVGDMGFTIKCLNAVREMASRSAVIFVSHNMQFVSTFCTHVMVLRRGRVHTLTSDLGEGVRAYMDCFESQQGVTGTGEARVISMKCRSKNSQALSMAAECLQINHGEEMEIELSLEVQKKCLPVEVHLYIMDQAQNPVVCYPGIYPDWNLSVGEFGAASMRIPVGSMELNSGRYSWVIAITGRGDGACLCRLQGVAPFQIMAEQIHWGAMVRHVVPL